MLKAWKIQGFALGAALISTAVLFQGCNTVDVPATNLPASGTVSNVPPVNPAPKFDPPVVVQRKRQPTGPRAPTDNDPQQTPGGFIPPVMLGEVQYWAVIYRTTQGSIGIRGTDGSGKVQLVVENRQVDAQYFSDIASLTTFLCNEDTRLISVQVEVRRYSNTANQGSSYATTGLFSATCRRINTIAITN